MEKKVLNEISQMKFLFGYKPGRVISEQELPEVYEDMVEDAEMEMSDVEFDFPEVAPAPDKEKTKEKVTTTMGYTPATKDAMKADLKVPILLAITATGRVLREMLD